MDSNISENAVFLQTIANNVLLHSQSLLYQLWLVKNKAHSFITICYYWLAG